MPKYWRSIPKIRWETQNTTGTLRPWFFPKTTEEVSLLMDWANRFGIPVTPRGAGSGLAGAAIPVEGAVVCSFEKMNRIIDIDTENLMVTVEPGVVTNALDKVLEPLGLFFAGYPMSEDICFIGGNAAENAGGGRAVKYGVTGTYILGAEIVTPTGKIMNLGGKRLKDVSGYNLLPLFVGSEGTLGLFTKIILRVIPRPAFRAVVLAGFSDASRAVSCVGVLKRKLTSPPSSIELMDGPTARATNSGMREADQAPIPDEVDALLLVEIDGNEVNKLEVDFAEVSRLLGESGGKIIIEATTQDGMERAWKLRKQVPWQVKRQSGEYHSLEDLVVPPSSVSALVDEVEHLRQLFAVPIAMFGHAGDGNFHVTPMKSDTMGAAEWSRVLDDILESLYRKVRELGGTISGEHGIGSEADKVSIPVH